MTGHAPTFTDTTWACLCGAAGTANDPAAAHAAHRQESAT